MKTLILVCLAASQALAASSTSSMSMSMGSDTSMSTSSSASAAASTSVDSSPEYSITALPAVMSAPSCVFNCMIPIGLADSSGCDDVTENCACLSAPADALDFLTGCVETVCQSSTSAYAASATSLYESYCNSVYGTSTFDAAIAANTAADASAAASSSMASVESVSSASASPHTTASTSPSASSTSKSESTTWSPPLIMAGVVISGVLFLIAL